MGVFVDIVHSYRSPTQVIRRQLAAGTGEERLMAYVMLASLATFVSRVPFLLRSHAEIIGPAPELSSFIGGNMAASLIFAPLFLYALAAVSHLLARIIGGQGDHQSARLALFWSLLVLQPLVLIRAYVIMPYAPENIAFIVSVLIGILFFAMWFSTLKAVEQTPVPSQLP